MRSITLETWDVENWDIDPEVLETQCMETRVFGDLGCQDTGCWRPGYRRPGVWDIQDRETGDVKNWDAEPRMLRRAWWPSRWPRWPQPALSEWSSQEPMPVTWFPRHGTARVHRHCRGPWAQTQGTGTRFFHRFLFRLILSVPSHLFKALGDGASRKRTIKRGMRDGAGGEDAL